MSLKSVRVLTKDWTVKRSPKSLRWRTGTEEMVLFKKTLVSTVNTEVSMGFLTAKGVDQRFLCQAGDVVCFF